MDLMPPSVRKMIDKARANPEEFWGRAALDVPWFKPWTKTFEWTPPTFKWFVGGETNAAYNALDHHVKNGRGGRTALIYANERGERRVFTFAQLLYHVEGIAAALRGLGVGKGDRITIYMPTMPEAIMLMLACARIGAIHLCVFAGFGSGALADRIRASGSKLIFATDVIYRKGKDVPLKGLLDAALDMNVPGIEHAIILKRTDAELPMKQGRDLTWDQFLEYRRGEDTSHAVMESNEPLYILATSGTTARPKLVIHNHGGYLVHTVAMGRWAFDLKPDDVFWATSDIGWAVGHAYTVYAPLVIGTTSLAYEGSLDYPTPETLWQIIEEFRVTGIFTSPTAARLLMRYGEEMTKKYDKSSVTKVFCAGEVLNAPAWEWLQKKVFDNHVPVIDHMWQTETGGPVFANPYGITMMPIKPGSAAIPMPGIEAQVVSPEGEPLPPNEKGIMVITRPFPGLTPALWGETERYGTDYWGRIPGKLLYWSGDSAMMDEDGYVWFAGRADEIIKIAAHRLGTIEIETAFLKHPAVAEAGVTGRPDELRGEVIAAFIVLKANYVPSDALRKELLETVRAEFGPIAVIGELHFVPMLPKTRSGKIMRRVLKAVVLERDPGDITTIEDEASVEEARKAAVELKEEIIQ
ncbi:MAG: acetate--CoA ligase [Anaerolineae bacterium]|nr:acetate--CoA ligase [Anaerolineae bacterium]